MENEGNISPQKRLPVIRIVILLIVPGMHELQSKHKIIKCYKMWARNILLGVYISRSMNDVFCHI